LKDLNRLKKERDKERQRQRRMDPEFRAKERVRNRILKRISRQKNYYTLKVQYFGFIISVVRKVFIIYNVNWPI